MRTIVHAVAQAEAAILLVGAAVSTGAAALTEVAAVLVVVRKAALHVNTIEVATKL